MPSYSLNLEWDEPTSSRTYQSLLKKVNFENGGFTASSSADSTDETEEIFSGGKVVTDNGIAYAPIKMSFPLVDDFGFDVKSNFGTQQDAMTELGFSVINRLFDLMNLMNTLGSLNGTASDSKNWMKFQVWQDTEPFRMSFKIQLNTMTDPFLDVYAPALALTNMGILSAKFKDKKFTGSYDTPGINWHNMKSITDIYKKTTTENGTTTALVTTADVNEETDKKVKNLLKSSGKIIKNLSITTDSLKIGEDKNRTNLSIGNINRTIKMLEIAPVFIESCKPTFSKHRTESGVPLYCDLEFTIQSVFAANDTMIIFPRPEVAQLRKGKKNNNLTNKIASTIFR